MVKFTQVSCLTGELLHRCTVTLSKVSAQARMSETVQCSTSGLNRYVLCHVNVDLVHLLTRTDTASCVSRLPEAPFACVARSHVLQLHTSRCRAQSMLEHPRMLKLCSQLKLYIAWQLIHVTSRLSEVWVVHYTLLFGAFCWWFAILDTPTWSAATHLQWLKTLMKRATCVIRGCIYAYTDPACSRLCR